MSATAVVGGSESDRGRVLEQHEAYLEANTDFDWVGLETIWSDLPEAVFFNLNGHTYVGKEHWIRLWKFYKQNVASSYWAPYDIGGAITGDLAVIWAHRHTKRRWTGAEPPPTDIHYDEQEFVSRSTMVFRKEADDWRVVHVHFSEGSAGARPGGI